MLILLHETFILSYEVHYKTFKRDIYIRKEELMLLSVTKVLRIC